jgi:F-type H+-transporting ATPase subunit gamma
MKMVSASKLKKAQDAILNMRPYTLKLNQLLKDLRADMEGEIGGEYAQAKPVSKVLLVAISSNRGLCGGFNSSIVKKVHKVSQNELNEKEVHLFTIGKKANDVLSKEQQIYQFNSQIFNELNFNNASEIAQDLMNLFSAEKFDEIHLIYNQFKNAATQVAVYEQFLPVKQEIQSDDFEGKDYIYEPEKAEIIESLIPKSLKMQLYKALRESYAAEHGARMTAMHMATDNANQLQKSLLLTYNKARQAAITNEILEIVGGAEALNQ